MVKTLGLTQIIVIVIVAVSLIMAWDFGQRILDTVELVRAAQAADQELAEAQSINAKLIQLKRDVMTDDWVIKKARADLHYARENETLFVPAATPPPPSALAPTPVESNTPTSNWLQNLLQALFGTGQ